MRTAYLVTQGEYSDYCVVRVYLDKEKAEQFVELERKRHGWKEGSRIEEMEIADDLDPSTTELGVNDEGKREGYNVYLYPHYSDDKLRIQYHIGTWDVGEVEMEIYPAHHYKAGNLPNMRIPFDRAKDSPEVAKKIFSDHLAKLAAEEFGISV